VPSCCQLLLTRRRVRRK